MLCEGLAPGGRSSNCKTTRMGSPPLATWGAAYRRQQQTALRVGEGTPPAMCSEVRRNAAGPEHTRKWRIKDQRGSGGHAE